MTKTPIELDRLEQELIGHPDRIFVDNLITGLRGNTCKIRQQSDGSATLGFELNAVIHYHLHYNLS